MTGKVVQLMAKRQRTRKVPKCEPPLHCTKCGTISFYLFNTTLVCAGCGLEIQNVQVRLL